MAVSIKEIVSAIHCLCSIEDHLKELQKEQVDFKDWMREVIEEFDDRLTRLELVEELVHKIQPEPKP